MYANYGVLRLLQGPAADSRPDRVIEYSAALLERVQQGVIAEVLRVTQVSVAPQAEATVIQTLHEIERNCIERITGGRMSEEALVQTAILRLSSVLIRMLREERLSLQRAQPPALAQRSVSQINERTYFPRDGERKDLQKDRKSVV